MAFYVGSFAGGLFNGAQSAMGLYQGWQSIQAMMANQDAANQLQTINQMNQVNANVPGWNPDTQRPSGQYEPAGDQSSAQSSTEGPVPQGSGTGNDQRFSPAAPSAPAAPAAPAAPVVPSSAQIPKTPPVSGSAIPGAGTASDATIRAQPTGAGALATPDAAERMRTGSGTQADTVEAQRQADLDAYKKANPTLTPEGQSALGLPVPQSGPPAPTVGRVPLPPQPPPFNPAGVQGPPGSPSGPPANRPDLNPVSRAVTGLGDLITGPSTGFTAAPPAPYTPPPPSVTQPVGGYFGSTVGPQTPPIPAGRPGGPVIPPPQTPAAPPPPTAQLAPTAPLAANAPPPSPPSLGSRIGSVLSAFNPIGTAEAAPRPPPQIPPAAQPASAAPAPAAPAPAQPTTALTSPQPPAVAPTEAAPKTPAEIQATALAQARDANQPVPIAGSDGLVAFPDGHVGKPTAPGPAVTTALPVKTDTPPTQAGPVTVEGGGKVAPDQTKPSTQSESTTVAMAPPVDPKPWGEIQQSNPQLARMITDTIAKYGRGVVSPEEVAAIAKRESGWQETIVSKDGYDSHGLMQVIPDTARAMEAEARVPPGSWNQDTAQGSLNAGVSYLAHLALDDGLGPHSAQTMYAYGRGTVGAQRAAYNLQAEQNYQPGGWKSLTQLYAPGTQFTQAMFTGGKLGPKSTPNTPQGVVQAAQGGPDQLLKYVANNGPAGLGMSDRWRVLQADLERSAILSGHFDMVPHIIDFVAQQSHQGTLSNLAAADNALSMGNADLAAQFLAKAHAFFPDGTMSRFGTDSKGNLWGEQFNEGSGASLGKPVQITNAMLREQMIMLQNPTNYVQALQKYQLENAQIDMVKNHGEYYKELPGIQQAKQEGMEGRLQERLEANERMQQERLQHQTELADARAGSSLATDERSVNTAINKDYEGGQPLPGEVPATLGKQSQIDAILRRNKASGGAAMAGPLARETARDYINGQGIKLDRQTDKNGITQDAVIGKDGTVRGYLSTDQGDRIRGLAGTAKPAATGGGQRAQNTGIGAGMNSPMVAMGGMNMNLSGMPTQPLPQQPQQAIG